MIVAHSETYMGLVEIGAGLLPGGGGCTNLWRRLVETIPGSVTVTDLMPYYIQAMTAISTAKVSTSAAEARVAGFLRPTDRIVFNKDYIIGEAKKEVLRMLEDGYVAPAKTMIPVVGKDGQGMMDAQLYNMEEGKYIPPHMKFITEKIAYVVSGGVAVKGMSVSEDYMFDLEREAFVELWKTENSQKMAEHIVTKGKPLMI
jgi:3-hydroxyacyl-CoA dehydrogenase